MVWFGIVLFAAVGIGIIVWRNDLAYWEGMTFGGTVPAGCVLILLLEGPTSPFPHLVGHKSAVPARRRSHSAAYRSELPPALFPGMSQGYTMFSPPGASDDASLSWC
jgi:hypothetical protein